MPNLYKDATKTLNMLNNIKTLHIDAYKLVSKNAVSLINNTSANNWREWTNLQLEIGRMRDPLMRAIDMCGEILKKSY